MELTFQQRRKSLVLMIVFACLGPQSSKGQLSQNSAEGLSFINFKYDEFFYLNITRIGSDLVQEGDECGFACLEITSCFSYNLAALPDSNGKRFCELLPSDKYNNSDKFIPSEYHHHYSISTPCSSNPCMNGATCVANYKDDDYQCACAPGCFGKHCETVIGLNCNDIKKRGLSQGDGMYLLDPDEGNHSNAFPAYCDMTSYNGGWTMCYTTDEYVKPKTEVTYSAQFPYGSDGYRTNCNNITFTEIMFIDHQTAKKVYFKRQTNQPITAAENYGNATAIGLWDGIGTDTSSFNGSYQLLICDHEFYSGFLVSGYTGDCYKLCYDWCHDGSSPFFRTAPDRLHLGVAFNVNGHGTYSNRLISVGLR